jgi:Skp family chaperone for outer membrane proteins
MEGRSTSNAGGISPNARTGPHLPANPSQEIRAVKRTVAIVAGILTLGVAVYVGSRLGAQSTTGGTASYKAPVTKVGIVNLSLVIQKYNKWLYFKDEYERDFKAAMEAIKPKGLQVEKQKKDIELEVNQTNRESMTKTLKVLERELQDMQEEAQNKLAKKNADEFVVLYREVEAAVKNYATHAGIELVMHYNDAPDYRDMYTPRNVARKMSSPGCMPLYMAPGIDISEQVIVDLNRAYTGPMPSRQTSTSTTTGGQR